MPGEQLKIDVDRIVHEGREYRRMNLLVTAKPAIVRRWFWRCDALCAGYEYEFGSPERRYCEFFDDVAERDAQFRMMRTDYYCYRFKKIEGPLP